MAVRGLKHEFLPFNQFSPNPNSFSRGHCISADNTVLAVANQCFAQYMIFEYCLGSFLLLHGDWTEPHPKQCHRHSHIQTNDPDTAILTALPLDGVSCIADILSLSSACQERVWQG